MSKNLVYIMAVLITALTASGGIIMAQQYQANNSTSAAPALENLTCPCQQAGFNCSCTANGQPCTCGQNGATCGCGSGQCHQKTAAP